MKKFETIINSFGALIGIAIIVMILVALTSCGTFTKMTEKEKELEYKIDKLYLEYSYKRDSLIIEYHKK